MCHLDEQIEFASPINNETNCFFFLKLKIYDSWLTYPNSIKHKWKPGTKSAEGITILSCKNRSLPRFSTMLRLDESLAVINILSLLKN